ncbi:MAG: HAD hydrolase-like protein [Candidatus Margulisbacteria bacterium]|jgi:HAD superfamily phosphatase (TIGR01668 family)|nr:HAD hydrolase-like protein [Candidatus Margulisiibacteriota bacterium]
MPALETVRELFTPREYLENIFALNLAGLQNQGIKLLLVDVNNTVLPADADYPSLRAIHWFEQLKQHSFRAALISSGWNKTRLSALAEILAVPVYAGVCKPALPALKSILAEYSLAPRECAIVGDALWSDVLLAKLLGAYSVLVKNCDQPQRAKIGLLKQAKGRLLENFIHKKI